MASCHVDVNLPRATWYRASSFLGEFNDFLQALGFSPWAVDKEPGGHLTNFWLYCRLDSSCPAKSQVQFGATDFAAVNRIPHSYARGRGRHLAAAVKLLEHFVSEVWAFQEQTPAVEPPPAPRQEDWEVLDMRRFMCPTSERVWYSTDDASIWFMPEADGIKSVCGSWLALQDEEAGMWWCNENNRQLFFTVA